ncbi:hypothetical protein ACFSTC_42805 [Nonomuraea ferruginea]
MAHRGPGRADDRGRRRAARLAVHHRLLQLQRLVLQRAGRLG